MALAMTGGGALAAYQVGVLRAIVNEWPDFRPSIITGVSAGAINASVMAARRTSFAEAVGLLSRLWGNLTSEQVFRTDALRLSAIGLRWMGRFGSAGRTRPHAKAFVDTWPLRRLLTSVLGAEDMANAIESNIYSGELDSIGISSTDYGTGRSVTWVQGRSVSSWQSSERGSIRTRIGIDHIMASSALPFVFPPTWVDGGWHGDGGIRQIAPLSPAVHLGADRILAVNTRRIRSRDDAAVPAVLDYPTPAQIAGVLMNAVFLDAMERDVDTLRRITRIVRRLPPAQRDGLRPIEVLVLRPSVDLAAMAAEHEVDLPRAVRYLLRGLGSGNKKSPDWLPMLLFEPAYLERVMAVGEADARARMDELRRFIASPVAQSESTAA